MLFALTNSPPNSTHELSPLNVPSQPQLLRPKEGKHRIEDHGFLPRGGRFLAQIRMALTMKQASLSVAAMGLISFILGVLAENTKPPSGTPITGKDVVICKYPADPSVYLGYLSVIFLIGSTVMGYRSLFYPYEGKSVPCSALFQTNIVFVFFNISLFTAGLGLTMLLHPTITGHLHRIRNVHRDLETHCPTAKTGVFGGGAFLSLDATLFWLLLLMLVSNAREDYFLEEAEEEIKADSAYDQESLGSM
ncbi:hypothetical protein SAY86_021601 [Trapa natans]|uniref:Uncharacterized protein n=1 Tax=Trapa natans TaxID=22666 RepID=A0AAN7M900_TRANT|nr:hypothetical protein SAY86_021601 [Trapa natans]